MIAVTTFTSTLPEPAGLTSVIAPSASLRKLVTCTEPKSTAEAFARFVPVIVTVVPPAAGPVAGQMPVTEGRVDAVT